MDTTELVGNGKEKLVCVCAEAMAARPRLHNTVEERISVLVLIKNIQIRIVLR